MVFFASLVVIFLEIMNIPMKVNRGGPNLANVSSLIFLFIMALCLLLAYKIYQCKFLIKNCILRHTFLFYPIFLF